MNEVNVGRMDSDWVFNLGFPSLSKSKSQIKVTIMWNTQAFPKRAYFPGKPWKMQFIAYMKQL